MNSGIRHSFLPRHITFALGLCLFVMTGCVQVHRTVELNRDGSGRLIETIRFEDQLLQMVKSESKTEMLNSFLSREHLLKRAAHFGKVSLADYQVKEVDGLKYEARAVFTFDNINDISIPAIPHRGPGWSKQLIRFQVKAPYVYRGGYYSFATFHKMPLTIYLSPGVKEIGGKADTRTPLDREGLRVMLPVIRAMLKGFHTTLKVRAFGPIDKSNTHTVIDVRDSDLDDDNTLLKILEWNRYPDKTFAWDGKIGYGNGKIIIKNYTINISFESRPSQLKPVNSLKKEKRG